MLSKTMSGAIAGAVLLFLLVVSPKTVNAVTLEITDYPSEISGEEFNIGVEIQGPTPGTNYLRIDLFKEGGTKYFGETFNGNEWYSGSDGKSYFPITISPESTASATVKGKVGTPSSSEYPGSGQYKLKVRRYTSSGNAAGSDEQTPITVQINIDFSTPTPSPTSSPTSTSDPTSAPTSDSTPTPTPTPTSTPKPTKKATLRPTPRPTFKSRTSSPSPTDRKLNEIVLGLSDQTATPESTDEGEKDNGSKFPFLAVVMLFGGAVAIGFSSYTFIKSSKSGYNQKSEQGPETDKEIS